MMATPSSRFATGAAMALVPLLFVWWMTTDGITATLRPVVSQVAQWVMPVQAVRADARGGWRVETSLLVTEGKASTGLEVGTFDVEPLILRRLSLSWPLLLALLLAPPRPPRVAARLAVALGLLAALFVAGACADVFSRLAMLVNHARIFDNDVLPNVRVAAPAYGSAAFFGAKLGFYASVYFQPLVAPPLLWLALNPRARSVFLGGGAGESSLSDPASVQTPAPGPP